MISTEGASTSGNTLHPNRRVDSMDMVRQIDTSRWLESVESIIKQCPPRYFEMKDVGGLQWHEMLHLLKVIENTKVAGLSLSGNNLDYAFRVGSEAFENTRIKNLRIEISRFDKHVCGYLRKAKLTHLNITFTDYSCLRNAFLQDVIRKGLQSFELYGVFQFANDKTWTRFVNRLCNTSLSRLVLSPAVEWVIAQPVGYLFGKLPKSTLIDLNLSGWELKPPELMVLSNNLKNSKLRNLNLSETNLGDEGMDILADGLKYSNVVDLDLEGNDFSGWNNFGRCLPYTRIQTLKIGRNEITECTMFNFPDFLKNATINTLYMDSCLTEEDVCQSLIKSLAHSNVTALDMSDSMMTDISMPLFTRSIVGDGNLTEVNLSGNGFTPEGFKLLGRCLKYSKLKRIYFDRFFDSRVCYINPVEEFKNYLSTTLTKEPYAGWLSRLDAKILCEAITDSYSSYLFLVGCDVFTCCPNTHSDTTAITHLQIKYGDIGDEEAKTIAKLLPTSKITHLKLSGNQIQCAGAQAIASVFGTSQLLNVNLRKNRIRNEGLEALAKKAGRTLITELNVRDNLGDRQMLVDTVIFNNRKKAHEVTESFKRIVSNGELSMVNSESVHQFIEDSLRVCKIIAKVPSAIGFLTQTLEPSAGRCHVRQLLSEFPQNLAQFVAVHLDGVSNRVELLKGAESLGLETVVESLLRNQLSYAIDKQSDILHPYVYKLLIKYGKFDCNANDDPEDAGKIIEYFSSRPDIEEGTDVIDLLN